MKKLFKIFFVLILTVSIFISFTTVNTAESQINSQESGFEIYMNYLYGLGIFTGDGLGNLNGEGLITREEFAKVILSVSGNEELYSKYANAHHFSDVSINHWSNGYIGAVSALGFMTCETDGLFHPEKNVTFSQVSIVIGQLLGYSDANLTGTWPNKYFTLLKNEGILDGITCSPTAPVSRNILAVMLHRMLQTKIYGKDIMFCDTTGTYHSIVILENFVIAPASSSNRIVTDKGIYYTGNDMEMPELGKIYIAVINDGIISRIAPMVMEYNNISVESVSSGIINKNGGGNTILPTGVTYYYKNDAISPDKAVSYLQNSSSVVLAKYSGDIIYGAVFDPVYSLPEIITQGATGSMLELKYGNKIIEREGKIISASQIEINDVVYEVTDILKEYGYVLVYGNNISGDITAIIPNKISPESIKIDGTVYELDENFPVQKINSSGIIETGETVMLLLGNNGKAIDIILSGTGENSDYVLVLDAYSETSIQSEDYGSKSYYVSLLHTDGTRKIYLTETDFTGYKGLIAKYTVTAAGEEYNTVSLSSVDIPASKSYEIKKEERMLDNSYVTDNIVIFNMIYNVYGRESDASVLKWSDLPNGRVPAGKLKYLHKTGDFLDIDVIYFDNILEEGISYGLVTGVSTKSSHSGTQQTLTMMIQGKQYSFTTGGSTGASTGTVMRVKLNNGNIVSTEGIISAVATSTFIEAVDSSRIKINGTIYPYHRDISIYELQQNNTWKAVGTSDLSKGSNNGNIRLYLDKPLSYGGKVVMIIKE
jgi:hypothetical protein